MDRIALRRVSFSLAALAALLGGFAAIAGPINPPAGPVAPTNKTLQEVEPRIAINLANTPGDATSLFKITQPGSYYLTGNIGVPLGKSGIEIAANNVTIDLMGFNIQAVLAAVKGITVDAAHNNLTVRNGTVTGFPQGGIDLNQFGLSRGGLVEQVHATSNLGNGIVVGDHAVVRDCTATSNGANGIVVGDGCSITGCSSSGNTGAGIFASSGSTITGSASVINTGSGILTSDGCTITGCSAFGNTLSGIRTTTGCTISNCTARGNILDGITVGGQCSVTANSCTSNGNGGDGAGIHTTGGDNRIEGNNCMLADRGVEIGGAGNIIIKNTCSGNTIDWVIVANNVFGPIIDRRAPASAAVSGFTAASTLGSTDPNANFSY